MARSVSVVVRTILGCAIWSRSQARNDSPVGRSLWGVVHFLWRNKRHGAKGARSRVNAVADAPETVHAECTVRNIGVFTCRFGGGYSFCSLSYTSLGQVASGPLCSFMTASRKGLRLAR